MPLRSSRIYKGSLAGVIVIFFVVVSFTQKGLNQKREVMGLTRTDLLENAPPMLAFTTVALGGFRGLIANVLWMRMADLQEQDKYFEMVQLADWITKLQPHFTTVWVHLAWNMSYNISIKFNDPRDRWQWVLRGIELLRDEGLRYNPNEPLIYRELAWHFQHKLGHNLDDYHKYYKAVWADEMTKVLGTGRPNFEELQDPKTKEAQDRVKLLREKYKMDPRWMKEVDDRYGPLEWRLPETHAVYWAIVGMEKTQNDKLKKEDIITLRRVIFQSMQLAFQRGRLVYPKKDSQEFMTAPNIDIVPRTNKAYEDMMELEPDKREHLSVGHRNFLIQAVYSLYAYNRRTQANQWYAYLREKYPKATVMMFNPQTKKQELVEVTKLTLDDFALSRFTEDINETSQDKIKIAIEGLLGTAYWNWAIGEDDLAMNYYLFAERIYERFQKEIGKDATGRVRLPALDEIREEVLSGMLDPQNGLEAEFANRLRSKLRIKEPAPPGATNAPSNAPKQPAVSTNSPSDLKR